MRNIPCAETKTRFGIRSGLTGSPADEVLFEDGVLLPTFQVTQIGLGICQRRTNSGGSVRNSILGIQVSYSFIFTHVNAQIVTSVTLSQQTALNHIRNALFATKAGKYNNLKATLLLPAKLVNFAGYLT